MKLLYDLILLKINTPLCTSGRLNEPNMGRTILIAEDYDDARHFMKLLVETFGYEVAEAANGLEAVENFESQFPDLILMDISMPVMDGLAATKAIREFEQGAKIPIIAVTAHGRQFQEKALEAGCNELLEKPVNFDSLETVINRYLGA